MANTRGRLVSKSSGGRTIGQQALVRSPVGHHEAPAIPLDVYAEPVRARHHADQREQDLSGNGLLLAGPAISEGQALQASSSSPVNDLSVGPDRDGPGALDLSDEVVGHLLGN